MKIQKKNLWGGGPRGRFGGGGGCQDGCERRIEDFVKILPPKMGGWVRGVWSGGSGRGVRVDVNKELKFL